MDELRGWHIGELEERELEGQTPVLRHWIQENGRVYEEEFNAVIDLVRHRTKSPGKEIFRVARDEGDRAMAVMGCGDLPAGLPVEVFDQCGGWGSDGGLRLSQLSGKGFGRGALLGHGHGDRRRGQAGDDLVQRTRYR